MLLNFCAKNSRISVAEQPSLLSDRYSTKSPQWCRISLFIFCSRRVAKMQQLWRECRAVAQSSTVSDELAQFLHFLGIGETKNGRVARLFVCRISEFPDFSRKKQWSLVDFFEDAQKSRTQHAGRPIFLSFFCSRREREKGR